MNFSEFLIRYTTINTKFIEDYANVFNDNYNVKLTIIDSEILRKWLKIEIKYRFEIFIKKHFKKDIDYKIEDVNTTGKHGGHLQHIIKLTPNTAKEICMMSRSQTASEVRKYFIAVEEALDKYKNHIIQSMQKKIDQLENNQKPVVDTHAGIIYVFRALDVEPEQSVYKIGRTISSKTRFNNHMSGAANNLEIVMTYQCDNTKQVESCIKNHMKLAQYRKYKEIYECDLDIIKKVIENCDKSISDFNNIITKQKNIKKGKNFKNIEKGDKLFMLIPSSKK